MSTYAATVPDRAQHVFGYGSLVALSTPDDPAAPALLHGHRRGWTTAMDNTHVISGYKRYLDPETGDPPDVCVAFLDVFTDGDADAGGPVNGVCRPVDADALAALDRRERNYDRVDVSALVDGVPGRVWTYRGSASGRARRDGALREGRLVVARAYVELVEAAFAAAGPDALHAYRATTDPPPCPARDLVF